MGKEYADLNTQRDSDYTKLKDTRAEVAELQKIRKCVDIALQADQPEQTRAAPSGTNRSDKKGRASFWLVRPIFSGYKKKLISYRVKMSLQRLRYQRLKKLKTI